MALTPQNNDAFFREVDDQLRQEQLATFWRRHGRTMLALVVAALALLAGYLWWQNHRAAQAAADGEALSGVLADIGEGKKQGATARLDALGRSPRPGYSASARLTNAALALEGGDAKGSAAQYKAIAADAGLPAAFRDLALVRGTGIEFDALPPADVIARLRPLAVAGGPWFGSAGEMVAIAHLKLNDRKAAGALFAAIARDKKTPESLRSRATRMAGVLGFDTIVAPAAAEGGAGR